MLTAKLVGEGFARPNAENELPLDINYAKLNEWLVDRKQVPADWNRKLQAIQAKAGEALRQLPPGFLGQFEGGEDIPLDYFTAQQVLARLSEGAEKGFLGGLKGAAGDWDKLVKAYEYNLIYVAEAAQSLCRNADFEVPFLRKQAARYQQQLADLERRKAEALRSAAAAAADFQQECQQLGIDAGGSIRGGLLGLTAGLPPLVEDAVEALRAAALTEAVEYYAAVAGSQQAEASSAVAASPPDLLPVLAEVREGRTQAPSDSAAGQQAGLGSGGDGGGGGLAVDWDLGDGVEASGDRASTTAEADGGVGGMISWDLDAAELAAAAEAPAGGAAISWDAVVEVGAEMEASDAPAAAAADAAAPTGSTISWDIAIDDLGESAASQQQDVKQQQQQQQASSTGAAAAAAPAAEEGPTVRRLVEDAAYRGALLDDLLELRAFLMQRRRELSGTGAGLLSAASAAEAEVVQRVDATAAGTLLEAVEAALAQWSGAHLKHLIALRTSARYLDRQAAGLAQRAGQEAKYRRAAVEAEARRGEAQRLLVADSAKLGVLLRRTQQAKQEVERALSSKLGRRVNVMGEVNQILAAAS